MDVVLIILTAMLLSWPLGLYLSGVFGAGQPAKGMPLNGHWSDRLFLPLERPLLKLAGVDASAQMNWRQYGLTFLAANLLLGLLAYGLLLVQHLLPLNPDQIPPLSWDLALHTAVSFLTNTNQQHYSGQAQLTLFSQSVVLVTLQFLTPKEYAVLAMLAQQPGKVVLQKQLLAQIWGPSHSEDSHYLRIVVSHLRQKLGDDPLAPRYLRTEAGIGYRLCL